MSQIYVITGHNVRHCTPEIKGIPPFYKDFSVNKGYQLHNSAHHMAPDQMVL